MEAQEQQAYHYQYQTLNDANPTALPPSYDSSSSSHLQSYDPSIQTYYASYRHLEQPQPQDNPSHYHPNSSYQTLSSDPNSIHPPGVPILADTQQSHPQSSQALYYSTSQPPPLQPYMLPSNTTYMSGGSRGRGSGRGTFGRRGRGRGGGNRGRRGPPQIPGSSGPVLKPPPQNVSCEICKVECNTLEILEQHKNGKKHQKKLQSLSQPNTKPDPQIQVSNLNIVNAPMSKPEITSEDPPKIDEGNPKTEPSSEVSLPSKKSIGKERSIGRGGKRGGRGGKFMKANDGSRREPVLEPPKPKDLGFPIVCELCNSRCESQVVYDSHIAGKKHLANAKRVETRGGLRQITNIPNLPLTSAQIHQSGTDAATLASIMLSQQNIQDPLAAQAALTQLLSQHGINDARTLLVQLIPYLLNQFQDPTGSFAAAAAGVPLANFLNPQTEERIMTDPLSENKEEEQKATNDDATEERSGNKEEEQKASNDDVTEGGVEKKDDVIGGGVEKDSELVEEGGKEDESVVEKEEELS